jgi:nitrous oxide reductase accessory protein NosL
MELPQPFKLTRMKKILLGIVAATLLLSCSVDEQKTSKVPQEF